MSKKTKSSKKSSRRRGGSPDYKALQLSRQIERALSYILADCDDDVLLELNIQSARPAPNAGRILVTVTTSNKELSAAQVLSRLSAAYGHIRTEVAASIHRRKTPELIFQFAPAGAQPEVEHEEFW